MSSSGSSWRSSSNSIKGNEAQYCETICNMVTMLSCSEPMDAPHRVLLAMTNSPESCQSLRRAGCIPLLIQILHPGPGSTTSTELSAETKQRAAKALKNIVHFNPDEKMKRKELRVLRLLESIRAFTNSTNNAEPDKHPTNSSTTLMKLSFDDEHKNTMCTLGAIHTLAQLILSDHKVHGLQPTDPDCILIRRYSCMTLTNLTFGDGVNKALLCSMSEFLTALVSQLEFENEDIVQVTASVLRNLSWHADSKSRDSLRDAHAVSGLMRAAVKSRKEPTLKATLSALWNLSAHSLQNKAAVCSTPDALKFLLSLLHRHKSMTIVENAGGILGSVSSHIASVDEYRLILRECHCFEILLEHLRSPSLAVVSNACGTLWNLSEHEEEQRKLLELNAVPMLKSLEYSKHERIRQGASETLRTLENFYCGGKDMEEENLGQAPSPPCDNDGEEQPLDLTITSCKSSPVRKLNPPPFLNPPIYNGNISSTRSCPDIQVKQQVKVESSTDEIVNYSHYDEEEEKNQQKDTVVSYNDEGTPGCSGSMIDLSNQVVDTLTQFQVEDTPAVFSTTSSLSSIDENQNDDDRTNKVGSDGKKSVLNIQLSSAPTNITTTTSPAIPLVVPKRSVMFSADETPLMFSRSSTPSVGSLECGDLNNAPCESDCVSDFSRRTSEAVSPTESELPDSPPRGSDPCPEQQIVDQTDGTSLVETDSKNNKPTTTDELKVFEIEGTPFFVSTGTSLSDIVGELEGGNQIIPPSQVHSKPSIPSSTNPEQELNPECNEESDYSDVQLLQKCIKAGRAVGWVKKSPIVVHEDEEDDEPAMDLSNLILRGRAKLLTRSEDNLKQYTTSNSVSSGSLVKPFNGVPSSEKNISQIREQKELSFILKNTCNNIPSKNINGSRSFLQLKQNATTSQDCNLNFLPQKNEQMDFEINQNGEGNKEDDANLVSTQPNKTVPLSILDRLTEKVCNINLSVSPGQYSPSENSLCVNDNEKLEGTTTTTVTTVKEINFPDKDDNADDTSQSDDVTWAEDTQSFSSLQSMSITKAMKIVARNEETLSDIEQPTLDSNSLISSTGCHIGDIHQRQIHQKQLLLLSSSSQVSNLVNQKPPEFVDLENSMISVASIKSEIFDESLLPVMSSPQVSSHSHTNTHVPIMTTGNPNNIANTTPTSTNNTNSTSDTNNKVVSSPTQSKYDTYIIKRIESPKERRKNDPERYLTRTIAKFDLKAKPIILPKPALASSSSGTSVTSVRPTRTSELRANHSREHSPQHTSPTHLSTSLNTTLPRNTKLMESSVRGTTPESTKDSKESSQHAKLNIGGRIGNLFRKKKDIWVKKREKALVPPFNYTPRPPPNEDGMNGNNSTTSGAGTEKPSSKITTV